MADSPLKSRSKSFKKYKEAVSPNRSKVSKASDTDFDDPQEVQVLPAFPENLPKQPPKRSQEQMSQDLTELNDRKAKLEGQVKEAQKKADDIQAKIDAAQETGSPNEVALKKQIVALYNQLEADKEKQFTTMTNLANQMNEKYIAAEKEYEELLAKYEALFDEEGGTAGTGEKSKGGEYSLRGKKKKTTSKMFKFNNS